MKTRLSEKMNAIWTIKKILETFEKKVASRKIPFSTWSDHLEISDFPHLWGKFLHSNGTKIFNALFNHDVGMKSNLKVQGYLTHVESYSYDALNAS